MEALIRAVAYLIGIPAVVLLLVMLTAEESEQETATPPIKQLTIQAPDATQQQQTIIKQAGELLFNVCSGLSDHITDIESVTASIGEVGTRNDGWRKGISFTVKITDNTSSIPREWRAWGHNLFYTVVGGNRPGIDVGKSTAGYFCNVGHSSPFIDVQKARLVDKAM